jgi:asparagine synthetase B (glutamine-hydrolysing)
VARFVIPTLLEHFDERSPMPRPFRRIYVEARAEQVTVVLSGDGGDLLFGGYPWRQVRPCTNVT